MTTTLTAEMVHGGLNPLFDRTGRAESLAPGDARELLQNSGVPISLLEGLWMQIMATIDRGAEHGSVVAVVDDLATLIVRCTKSFEVALERSPGLAPGSAEAENAGNTMAKLTSLRTAVSELQRRLNVALPVVNREQLSAPGGERSAAGFVTLEDVAARIKSRECI